MSKALVLACAMAALAGCATAQERAVERLTQAAPAVVAPAAADPPSAPTMPVREKILADLAEAEALARANGDTYGVQCWAAAQKFVSGLPLTGGDIPRGNSPAAKLEAARLLAKRGELLRGIVAAGVPDELTTACAVVVQDARAVAARLIALFGLAAP